MRYPKVPSNELFWSTLKEGSEPAAKSFSVDSGGGSKDKLEDRVLQILQDAGGTATFFEVWIRSGEERPRIRLAVERLARKDWLVKDGIGDEMLLRLHPQARRRA